MTTMYNEEKLPVVNMNSKQVKVLTTELDKDVQINGNEDNEEKDCESDD
jgi:hypothetical protein